MPDRVWPCDRMLCFRQAKWIIVIMPPISDAEMDALGLGDMDEFMSGEGPIDEKMDAFLQVLVPAAGRHRAKAEIRCDKHAEIGTSPRRLSVPIERYVRLFGFPRDRT